MATNEQITGALEDVGAALRERPSVRDAVLRRVTEHAATNGAAPRSRWGGGGRGRLIGRVAAVAACAAVALLVWNPWGRGAGAGEAFAAAIANVERARTFACRQIVTEVKDGQEVVREMSFMFREPDLERIEYGEGMPQPGEYMVTDYDKRVRLVVLPEDKAAALQDLSTTYAVDQATGELKPTELGTHARDDVLRISAQAVKDLGMIALNGRNVWVLQSEGQAEPVKTVYVNPEDGKPVQIELAWPSKGQTFAYTDIQLDVPMDDSLFSLEPPAGYAVNGGKSDQPAKPVDETNGKMMAKVMALVMECYKYKSKNDNRWPAKLDDLSALGATDAQKLKTLLAAPESTDGKPVLMYRQPREGETDAIVVYEAPEFRRGGNVVAAFMDGHAELLSRKRFEDLMK